VRLNAVRQWSQRSLANSFALRAASIAIVSVLVVSAISMVVIFWTENRTQEDRLQEKAERLADRVEQAIAVMESTVAELAKSPIFNTALLDSRGRDVYVRPFFENYSFPIAVANGLALCDINGERLAGTRSTLSDCRAGSPLFTRVIADGKTATELVRLGNGHLAWTSYQPVVFAYTGTVEGVVVTQLDLQDALRTIPADLDVKGAALMRGDSAEVLVSAGLAESAPNRLAAARAVLFKGATKSLPFPIEARVSDHLVPFGHTLPALVLSYGLGAVLLLLGIVLWARRVSLHLIEPLVGLTNIARTISQSGDANDAASARGADEVGQLEGAFQAMVTTLQASQATLQESERRLRTIYDVLPVGITLSDPVGNIIDCNAASERILGIAREEHVQRKLGGREWLIRRPDGSPMPAEEYPAVRALKENRIIRDVEMGLVKPQGTTWLSVSAMPADDPKYGVAVSYTDITERKQAEAERRIAAIAFESQEGIVITDAENVILRVNQAFTDITGYAPEEAVGRSISLLKSGRHDNAFYAAMWESIERAGTWKGEVWNRRKNGEQYPQWLTVTAVKGGAEGVSHYVGTMTDITLRKAAEDQIRHLAFYDSLTRLPNRQLLLERLQHALTTSERSGRHGALLYIDLDNFKTLNDTLGHDTGDLLLQQVAQRLAVGVREGDTVSRLGGDEFVVMLEDLSQNAAEAVTQTRNVGEKIRASLDQLYPLAGRAYHSTPSIGVTLFRGHGETVDELLKRSDLAMYQAKAAGRNALRFFDPDMQAAVNARATLEADLRAGLRDDQLLLHYQAQVDGEGHLTGAEALVRWRHPQRGVVSPAAFIALAEESGLTDHDLQLLGTHVLPCALAGEQDHVSLFGAQTSATDADIRCGEGRQIVFVAPDAIPHLDLSHLARTLYPAVLAIRDVPS